MNELLRRCGPLQALQLINQAGSLDVVKCFLALLPFFQHLQIGHSLKPLDTLEAQSETEIPYFLNVNQPASGGASLCSLTRSDLVYH